ncbi:hypothetical protein [Altererythrobacter sp. TH136]|uniref:hypothetical protein n=1 Tax=Altererythrobacter sp. TH136 TaxID=2067415 RepID=UPI0011623193|nr:hypothetical protein [Altererythrobacter sp. TH136]QDM40645.1 hypothetical protein C0V74_06005 [Altererythrobacter sp. TH136]
MKIVNLNVFNLLRDARAEEQRRQALESPQAIHVQLLSVKQDAGEWPFLWGREDGVEARVELAWLRLGAGAVQKAPEAGRATAQCQRCYLARGARQQQFRCFARSDPLEWV